MILGWVTIQKYACYGGAVMASLEFLIIGPIADAADILSFRFVLTQLRILWVGLNIWCPRPPLFNMYT
jgi:hypothetical protein